MLAAGNAMGFQPFGMLNALAQTSSDYKALVCVFLYGGNDGNNTLIPFDSAGYQKYSQLRGPLALPQGSLLQLSSQPDFALHPALPQIQALFNSGNAAFLANVGTLLQPTTRAQYLANAVTTPGNLFSHPDQQSEWHSQMSNSAGGSGWAGRLADRMNPQFNPGATVPMVTSLDGEALFCTGVTTAPVMVSATGPTSGTCRDYSYCSSRLQTAQQLSTLSTGVTLVQADNEITSNAYTYNNVLKEALGASSPLQTVFPPTASGIGAQLQEVANLIKVRAALGVTRQIFFVGFGNFDTHGDQVSMQGKLLAELSPSLGAFYEALVELNVASQVTTFTCSDFARTLQPNSAAGSDHAWGNHHLIFGGAVKGGKIYGAYPTLALGGPDDAGSNGRWVPTTATAQYAATLAQWFGLSASDLPFVLPYIENFGSNNLGFLG